ncbi:MAG: OmpH family outer membrane protein [Deltaproteobacteria bacterium]|jgi:outer membrane protein|nr:OmpH family outer membrane protein [Deltaproteobacteria bacterium]MCL5879415.1 OmpH family outer membrane protein [Deltaproteobacteria bacterium]MDA8304430.1 OmpH family outer membrane protein [Deltaproteobacteria bacterium]
MKRLIFNLSLAAILTLFAVALTYSNSKNVWAAGAGSSIAVVNMQNIISMSNQGKKANAELKALYSTYTAKLLTMRKKIAAIQNDLKQNGSIMSASEKARKTKEFETDISKFSAEEKHVQGVMAEKRYTLLRGIVDKATAIVTAIAKKNGYLLVIDRPSVVYRAQEIDITNEVLKQMNSK